MRVPISESMLLGHALAAMSHELKNVLAISGEGAGLMEDILEIAEEQNCSLPENMSKRFNKALLSIKEQVARGHRLTTDMNRLAHFPDTRLEPQLPLTDIGETAALAMRLTARRANQGKVAFQQPGTTGLSLPADPQLCLAAILALLEWALETAAPDSTLAAETIDGTTTLEFYGVDFPQTFTPDMEELAEAAGLEIRAENQRVRVTLTGSRT